jgi:hypothetical protein
MECAAVSLLSGVAGVAPACALAGAFAKASAQASSGPAIRSIVGSFWFDDSKPRGGGPVPTSNVKENLSAYFGVFGIFEGERSAPPPTPAVANMGVGSDRTREVDPNRRQCFA